MPTGYTDCSGSIQNFISLVILFNKVYIRKNMGVEHMKKRQIAFVLGVLVVLNGLVTISPINAEEACLNITDTVEFVNPLITEENEELLITLPQATSYRSSGGYLLPTVTKVITLPFQSSVESVEVEFSTGETISVSHQPVAVEQSVSDTSRLNQISLKGQKSLMEYPTEESFSYHVSAGKLGSEIVNYLVIQHSLCLIQRTSK